MVLEVGSSRATMPTSSSSSPAPSDARSRRARPGGGGSGSATPFRTTTILAAVALSPSGSPRRPRSSRRRRRSAARAPGGGSPRAGRGLCRWSSRRRPRRRSAGTRASARRFGEHVGEREPAVDDRDALSPEQSREPRDPARVQPAPATEHDRLQPEVARLCHRLATPSTQTSDRLEAVTVEPGQHREQPALRPAGSEVVDDVRDADGSRRAAPHERGPLRPTTGGSCVSAT